MTPGSFPLALYRGDTAAWQFKLWTDEAKTAPSDLTGVTAKAEIRDKPSGAIVVVLACTITLPNIIDVKLSAEDSEDLPAKAGAWDLQLTYPSGSVATVLAGAVTITADVTDSG